MKAMVEWGKPKAACPNRPCGVSGQFPMENATQARKLAGQLVHTLTEGRESVTNAASIWGVAPAQPRQVWWSSDRTAWVAVSLLDNVPRGAYAAHADKDALAGTVTLD